MILCFDERYEHYVVFSLSTTLHFVHTDSLKDLDLVQSTAPGSKRRPWVLAEIMEKEYCQARKVSVLWGVLCLRVDSYLGGKATL